MANGGPTPIEPYFAVKYRPKKRKIKNKLRDNPDYRENYGL